MKKWKIGCIILLCGSCVLAEQPQAPTVPYLGADLLSTNAPEVAAWVINAGQMAGLADDGVTELPVEDLLPMVVQSLAIAATNGVSVLLDDLGVFALRVDTFGFSLLDGEGQTVGVVTNWNDVIKHVDWSAVANLPPVMVEDGSQIAPGTIALEHLAFPPQAGGDAGEVQFNEGGQLTGHPDFFVHAASGLVAMRGVGGEIMRVYRSDAVDETGLLYSLSTQNGNAVLRLYHEGEETVRMAGDGSLYLQGSLHAYTPAEGDISMGAFTQK